MDKRSRKFIELKNELIELDDKLNANFNLSEGGTKNISTAERKRFVDDIDSGKINNEKTGIERYLKYIYPDKQFLDTRNITERTTIRNGINKGKKIFVIRRF